MSEGKPTQGAERRYSGCLVMLLIAFILGGLFYGILWGLQGAYLGELSPKQAHPALDTQPTSTSGAQP